MQSGLEQAKNNYLQREVQYLNGQILPMKKLIPLVFIFILSCSEHPGDKIDSHQAVSKQENNAPGDQPRSEPSLDSIKTRIALGETGYSILLPASYSVNRSEDSTYSIETHNPDVFGELRMTFIQPQFNPAKKVSGKYLDRVSFTDEICNTICEVEYFSAFESSLIYADILSDYRIRIKIATRKKDNTKPELLERNRLYGILKSLQKD